MTRAAAILLSAGAFALAFPPWNLSFLAWIALVPLFVALHGLTAGRAAAAGFLWGTAALSGIGYWVPGAMSYYWEQPYWFGFLFALGVAVVFKGSYFALFGVAYARLVVRRSLWTRPFAIAALYVTAELARATLLTGHPWLLLGYALVPHPVLIQAGDLGGVHLLSFVVALANAFVADAVRRRALAPAVAALMVLAATAGYGVVRLRMPLPTEPSVPVMVVQGNVDLGAQWRDELYAEGLGRYLELTLAGAAKTHPKLIVWPESAVTFFLDHEPTYAALIAEVLRPLDAELILGGPRKEGSPARFYNAAFHMTPDGRIDGHYDKVHLLPFAEYFPLRTIELLRRRFERVRWFTPAAAPHMLRTRHGEAATLICFEAVFPGVVRRQTSAGASFMLNLSNDGWFGRTAGADQHLQMVALRAVESRLWVVRATTTGVSAIIDPYGRITVRAPLFTAATLDARIVPMQVTTPYERAGDLFAYACVLASVVALVVRR